MSKIRLRNDIDAETLRAHVDYDPISGKFYRRGRRSHGKETGYRNSLGYFVIGVLGKSYQAHRLAWLHVHGEWPPIFIDHINRNPSDNRIANLRPATPRENSQNRALLIDRFARAQARYASGELR